MTTKCKCGGKLVNCNRRVINGDGSTHVYYSTVIVMSPKDKKVEERNAIRWRCTKCKKEFFQRIRKRQYSYNERPLGGIWYIIPPDVVT